MFTKSEIIAIMNHAIQLIEQLGGENEIADDLSEAVYQLEEEWTEQLGKEAEEED